MEGAATHVQIPSCLDGLAAFVIRSARYASNSFGSNRRGGSHFSPFYPLQPPRQYILSPPSFLGPCISRAAFMAALYLHNSIWVADAAESPRGHSPHTRTISSATLQTLPISDQSHTTQPLLHSSTSESVAYLDLLSRQPTHPNAPRGSPLGLSFSGDPTTMRERKGYADRIVRRRLRRLKAMMAVLEVIMGELFLKYLLVRVL